MKYAKGTMLMLLLCLVQVAAFTNTWTISEENGQKILKDETGKTCEVFSDVVISEDTLDRIETALNTLWSIPGLKGTRGRVNVEPGNYFHFIIYPETLVYNDMDFKPYLPSGLSFRYDSALFYDVTLKVGAYLPRVSGAYVSPDDFLDQLYSVYIMPELYLHGDVLLRRIERLEDALMAISKKTLFTKHSVVSDEIVLEIILLHNQNPNITVDEVHDIFKEKGIDASKKDIEAVFMVYLGKFE